MSGPRRDVDSPTTLMVVNTWGCDGGFYSLDTFEELSRFETPRTPHEVRHDRKRNLIYVSVPYRDGYYDEHDEKASELAVLDLERREVVDVIDLAPEVGPHGMCLDADADVLWLSVETDGGAVIGVDLETRQVVTRTPTGKGDGCPHWITMTSDASKIYTANKESRFASAVDAKRGRLIKQIPVSGGSEDVELSGDETRLFISSREEPILHVIDTETDEEVDRVELDDVPGRLHLTTDGKLIVTHFHFPYQTGGKREPGRISIVDPDTLQQLRAATVEEGPVDLTSSPDGKLGYICCARSGTILEVDLESLAITRKIDSGNAPHGVLLL
jgi:DNA-binding beta-propeller fold protein YncE